MSVEPAIGPPAQGLFAVSPMSAWRVINDTIEVVDSLGQPSLIDATRRVEVQGGTTLLVAVDYSSIGTITDVKLVVWGNDYANWIDDETPGFNRESFYRLPFSDGSFEVTIPTDPVNDVLLTPTMRRTQALEVDLKGHNGLLVGIATAFDATTSVVFAKVMGKMI